MGSLPDPTTKTLLDALTSTTRVDYDGNDQQLITLFPDQTFTDMTSNQAIVFGELAKPHHATVLIDSCRLAQNLVEQGVEGAKGRDIAAVAVDLAGITLAKAILPHLKQHGLVHAQTSVAAANSCSETVAHGLALVKLFNHMDIPTARVCLKVPATIEGLRACAELERQGINTLATVVFTVEQALAGAQAGCRYVATYVNPLHVHFKPGTHIEKGLHGLEGWQVLTVAQQTIKQRGLKRTSMMAASLVTIPEAVSLAGLNCSTISPALLALCHSTPLTAELEQQVGDSQRHYLSSPAAPEDLDCNVETEVGAKNVATAIEDNERVKALIKEALDIFGQFEMDLMANARECLSKIGEGH
ncbi:hypothetical protein OIO90_004918 [Microbotryomycetes sp. JL221]|nr:hypothetical protein OIO90_004918 [Microbotryomycetes sp. JL221]